jgi:tRNA (mo5U34)-methyltransferase
MPTLFDLATDFHRHLKSVKAKTPLDPRVTWYPWASLAALKFLDEFLNGDAEALRRMIGPDPVLDLGCGDGDVAFFLESLGARVDAVDHAPTNYNALLGVHALKQALDSKIGIHVVDVDSRPNLPQSSYGLTILLGVLYHLKNPFLVLETLARHSRHLLLSTRVASVTPDRKLNFGDFPVAYLVDETELNDDPTNFWIFSEPALKRMLRRCGWDVRHYTTGGGILADADPVSAHADVRAYVLAESRFATPAAEFHLEKGWHHLEHGIWRWTSRRFGARMELRQPISQAALRFQFHLPEPLLDLRPITKLRAIVNGTELEPQMFTTAGDQEYVGTIPSVSAGPVQIDFELDEATVIGAGDSRELGVYVNFAGASPLTLGSA